VTVITKQVANEQVHKQEDEKEQEQEIAQSDDQEQSSVDEFSSFIRRNTNDLIYIIKTQFGLLDTLVSKDVLNTKQASLIEEKNMSMGRAKQLLEEITRESISDEKKELFLTAFDETQHKHVSNFIRGKGVRSAEYEDHWPLYYCNEYSRMTVNRSKLIDLVDSKNGLLDEMFSSECINNQQKHSVDDETTDENRTKTLYFIVLWEVWPLTRRLFAVSWRRINTKLCPC